MSNEELINLQNQLDEKKYLESEIAKIDLGGLMSYCDNCAFKRMDIEKNRCICNLDRKSVEINCVCARNYIRNNEENELKNKLNKRRTKNSK